MRKLLPYVFDLVEHEGLCLGGSTAINIAGAVRLARDLGPGHTIVTILCDYGNRYQSKLFNPDFLEVEGSAAAGISDGEFRYSCSLRESSVILCR